MCCVVTGPCFVAEESVRERQLMAAEAGPSDAVEEFEELQDPPFPDPEPHPMALCDLLGLAAELAAAGRAQDCE